MVLGATRSICPHSLIQVRSLFKHVSSLPSIISFFVRSIFLQVGKGAGGIDEDDAAIANIQFGGPKVRRLADGDDSSSDGAGDAAMAAPAARKPKDSGHDSTSLKGKGKKRPSGDGSAAAGGATHRFQPSQKSGGATSGGTADVHEEEEGGGGGNANAAVEGPGSMLVSAIEAQAKREAEKIKAGVEGSVGTKIVVKKHKKRRDKGGGDGEAGGGASAPKKRKKHKSKEKSKGKNSGVTNTNGAAAPAEAGAGGGGGADSTGLGGLNLLGSYASSSGSDGDGDAT